jgi:Protein of unknown function (DUF3467)
MATICRVSGYGHDAEANGPEIEVPHEWLAGAYANRTSVYLTPDELTIDFARIAPDSNRGIVVARVAMSRWAANALAVRLRSELQAWAEGLSSEPGEDSNGETSRPES